MSLNTASTIAGKGPSFDTIRESGRFPPIRVLNSFFRCGFDDTDSDVTLHWEPFVLSESEFAEFFRICASRYGPLKLDDLGFDDDSAWFSAVALLNRQECQSAVGQEHGNRSGC